MKKISLFIILGILIFGTGCHRTQQSAETQNTTFTIPDSRSGSANQTPLDSLLQWAAVAPLDTNLALAYYEIAEIYKDHDFDKAKQYYLKLSNLSEELDWDNGRYLFTKAYTLLLTQEMSQDTAKKVEQRKNELTEAKDNEMDIGKMQTVSIARSLGETLIENIWFEQILQYYSKKLSETRNEGVRMGAMNLMIATVYKNIHAQEKAVEFCEKAVALLKNDPYALTQLARTYTAAFQYEKAMDCFEKAIVLCEQQNDLFLSGSIYSLFAYSCLYSGNFEKGAILAQQALKITRETENPLSISNLILIAKLEQMQNHQEESDALILEALQLSVTYHIRESEKICKMILSEHAVVQQKPLPVYDKEELYQLDDMTAIEATYWVATEMETAYETAKKDLEIEKQQNIISKQKMQRNILMGCTVFSGVILLLLWFLLRLRRRRNSALQEKTEILTEMNATKNKFFSLISHDLKNPAISLRDALQILLINAHSWDVDALNKYYNELLKSAENHVEFIYGLLSWAQIQTGRISFTPVPFFLPKLLPAISMIRKMAENKGIILNISIPEEAVVSCDVNMLLTVVRNLLTNAVKFTPTGGTVKLDVAPCRDAINRVSTKYTISISDTGIGMSQQQIAKLFHLDSLHSQKGTNGEEGSGLGLIICKEFLEKHNSALHIESEVGKGSRVWFEI